MRDSRRILRSVKLLKHRRRGTGMRKFLARLQQSLPRLRCLPPLAAARPAQLTEKSAASACCRKVEQLARPDWLTYSGAKDEFTLRPVTAADLVTADGQCAMTTAEAPPHGSGWCVGAARTASGRHRVADDGMRCGAPRRLARATSDRRRRARRSSRGHHLYPRPAARRLSVRGRPAGVDRARRRRRPAPRRRQKPRKRPRAPDRAATSIQRIAASSASLAASQSSSARASAFTAFARSLASWAALAGSRANSPASASSGVDARDLVVQPRDGASASAIRRRNGASSTRKLRGGTAGVAAAGGFRPLLACLVVAAVGQHQPPVVVEVAVERRHLSVGDQPEPVGARLDQVAVVRNQDHRARRIR